MALEHDPQEATRAPGWLVSGPRMMGRLLMLALIAGLAWARGYGAHSWVRLGVAIVWAISLPLIFRWLWLALARTGWKPWLRGTILALVVTALLGSFVFGVRELTLPG